MYSATYDVSLFKGDLRNPESHRPQPFTPDEWVLLF